MEWTALKLWADDEEKRIHTCITEALQQLIASESVSPEDDELAISGKLRPHLYRVKKQQKLSWTLQPEASSFAKPDAARPFGHPDIRFSCNTPTHDQYDYDVECKLVRVRREGKNWDYCSHYITDGVKRFLEGKYAQTTPPMGALIGYVQAGEFVVLLDLINGVNRLNELNTIELLGTFLEKDVTILTQSLQKTAETFLLNHLWVDLR